jgi:hypothetical protein
LERLVGNPSCRHLAGLRCVFPLFTARHSAEHPLQPRCPFGLPWRKLFYVDIPVHQYNDGSAMIGSADSLKSGTQWRFYVCGKRKREGLAGCNTGKLKADLLEGESCAT